MKAVIDEDLPRSLGNTLSKLGFKVYDIRNHGLRGSSDEVIFSFAQRQKAVLFSADLGFANLLQFPVGNHFGIVILRFPNEMSVNEMLKHVKLMLDRLKNEDYIGNLIIASPGKLRIRRREMTH